MKTFYRIGGWLLLCGLCGSLAGQTANSATPRATVITVNVRAAGQRFPHFWERMFGSGHAILALRQSYRRDLTAVHRITGFRYIRFHGIFDRNAGVFHLNAQGRPVYNWTYVDQIYDGLLRHGIRPFVEISFMPRELAARPLRQGFFYHPYVAPPKHWAMWGSLIRHFARHLIARYGLAEVSRWYFEVWNEPNLDFWMGKPKQATYFHLYDVTARALKSVSPDLRVGGPATAQAAWVGTFLRHCHRRHVPVDFVSTHVYGNDTPKVLHRTTPVPQRAMVGLAVDKVYNEVLHSPWPHLPIIFSEYNASYGNHVNVTDAPYMGPWLANTIRECAGKVKIMSYWAFSDVFVEQGVAHTPFYGGFGLMATGHIPKPAYNAFALLHHLGTRRLPSASRSALVTRAAGGALEIALWNYAPVHGPGRTRSFDLRFRGLRRAHAAYIQTLDPRHGDALAAWRAIGSPAFPSRAQQQALRKAAQLPPPQVRRLRPGHEQLRLTLKPYSLTLVRVPR